MEKMQKKALVIGLVFVVILNLFVIVWLVSDLFAGKEENPKGTVSSTEEITTEENTAGETTTEEPTTEEPTTEEPTTEETTTEELTTQEPATEETTIDAVVIEPGNDILCANGRKARQFNHTSAGNSDRRCKVLLGHRLDTVPLRWRYQGSLDETDW